MASCIMVGGNRAKPLGIPGGHTLDFQGWVQRQLALLLYIWRLICKRPQYNSRKRQLRWTARSEQLLKAGLWLFWVSCVWFLGRLTKADQRKSRERRELSESGRTSSSNFATYKEICNSSEVKQALIQKENRSDGPTRRWKLPWTPFLWRFKKRSD